MQYAAIPSGPTRVPANLDIKEMDEFVLVRQLSITYHEFLDI